MLTGLRGAFFGLALVGMAVGFAPGGAKAAQVPESEEPIKLAINEWTG